MSYQEKDKKDPAKLLVSHNKSPNRNYHHKQNVLGPSVKDEFVDLPSAGSQINGIDAVLSSSSNGHVTPGSKKGSRETLKKKPFVDENIPAELHTTTGDILKPITPEQLSQGIALAIAKTSTDIVVENAAQLLSQFVFSVLGGHKRLSSRNHNSQPLVCILVGSHDHASAAVAAGRRLCAIGIKVVLRLLTPFNVDNRQLLMFQAAGGYIPTENFDQFLNKLTSPIELVVDVLTGFHPSIDKNSHALIQWANDLNVLILSVDIPSGYTVQKKNTAILPKWTLALGAVTTTLAQAALVKQAAGVSVFVGNLGTGSQTWAELGILESQVTGQYLAQISCTSTN